MRDALGRVDRKEQTKVSWKLRLSQGLSQQFSYSVMSLAGTSDVCECIFEQHHCPEAPRYQPLRHFFLQDTDFTLASAHEGRPPAGKRGRVRRSGDSNRDKKSVLQFLQAQAIEN